MCGCTGLRIDQEGRRWNQKQGNVVHCGPVVFVCFENKHLAISITLMALSVTMDFAPCSNALRFTALCVHFVLFPMGFTSPCANQRKKKRLEASNMLGSCCIHDRPDIDTYLAYLDMYTDSYMHICKYYIYNIFISIYIYMCVCNLTHAGMHTLRYGSVRNAMRLDMVMKMYTP